MHVRPLRIVGLGHPQTLEGGLSAAAWLWASGSLNVSSNLVLRLQRALTLAQAFYEVVHLFHCFVFNSQPAAWVSVIYADIHAHMLGQFQFNKI